jgi:hypothetical protein
MTTTVKAVLSAFNSDAGTAVKFERGAEMVTLADGKSAYGRALRDVTAVALSGRWQDNDGRVLSDNAIGHALGVAMRQPRARLNALTASGLEFHTDTDIHHNAAVWAHVAKMYNAGKGGRDAIRATVETVAAIVDVDAKRAAWLSVPVPPREENKRAAKPNDGTDALSEADAEAGNAPAEGAERIPIATAETSTLLAYLASIGTELRSRIGDMTVAERATFRDVAASLTSAAKESATR